MRFARITALFTGVLMLTGCLTLQLYVPDVSQGSAKVRFITKENHRVRVSHFDDTYCTNEQGITLLGGGIPQDLGHKKLGMIDDRGLPDEDVHEMLIPADQLFIFAITPNMSTSGRLHLRAFTPQKNQQYEVLYDEYLKKDLTEEERDTLSFLSSGMLKTTVTKLSVNSGKVKRTPVQYQAFDYCQWD